MNKYSYHSINLYLGTSEEANKFLSLVKEEQARTSMKRSEFIRHAVTQYISACRAVPDSPENKA